MRRTFDVSAHYTYVKARELEGTLHDGRPSTGSYLQTGMRVNKGWGLVSTAKYPRLESWPPTLLTSDFDDVAKFLCLPIYTRVRDLDDALNCLGNGLPVVASFYISHPQWAAAKDGKILDRGLPNDQAHCVLLCGYNIPDKTISFQNWWKDWGDEGFGKMSFDYFEKNLQEAYLQSPPENPNLIGGSHIARDIELPTGSYSYLEARDIANQASIGWIIIRRYEDRIEIEELYVRPSYRRQGYGTKLLGSVFDMANDDGLPLIAWIGIADVSAPLADIGAINTTYNKFRFSQHAEHLSWAKYSVRSRSQDKRSSLHRSTSLAPGSAGTCLKAGLEEDMSIKRT